MAHKEGIRLDTLTDPGTVTAEAVRVLRPTEEFREPYPVWVSGLQNLYKICKIKMPIMQLFDTKTIPNSSTKQTEMQ